MNGWMRWTLALTGAAVGGTVMASAIGSAAWNRQTARLVHALDEAAPPSEPRVYTPDELGGLPEPVVRYFEFALTPGQPMIRGARVEHRGQFRTGMDAPWGPFHSVQHFAVHRPGFVWDADVSLGPLLKARVRDSYVAGRGGMRVRVAGLIPVVDQENTPHLNAGALHRWLLESAWLPTALLPSQGVRWEPIDETSARATRTDGGITVSMDVHFEPNGRIARIEALRQRDVDGAGVATPFVGRVGDYRRIDGMMVPVAGEVEWILPEGRFSFWRGRIVEVRYDFQG